MMPESHKIEGSSTHTRNRHTCTSVNTSEKYQICMRLIFSSEREREISSTHTRQIQSRLLHPVTKVTVRVTRGVPCSFRWYILSGEALRIHTLLGAGGYWEEWRRWKDTWIEVKRGQLVKNVLRTSREIMSVKRVTRSQGTEANGARVRERDVNHK